MNQKNPTVDTKQYPERPLKEALAPKGYHEKAEARPQKDQIEDYHKTHPTLREKDLPKEVVTPDADQ